MAAKTRTVGSLTHADFGKAIRVPGYPEGVLWGIQHTAAIGDIPEAWTRVIVRRTHGPGSSESTRGLSPATPVVVLPAPDERAERISDYGTDGI
jgi:hypothetical protein